MTMINISLLLNGGNHVAHVMQKENESTRGKREEMLNVKLLLT